MTAYIGLPEVRIVTWRGTPVIGLPGDKNLRKASAQRLQAHTVKRRIFYGAIRAFSRAPNFILATGSSVPVESLGIDLACVAADLQGMDSAPTAVCLVWPWPAREQGTRLYAHWLGTQGDPIAFTKLIGEADKRPSREGAALRYASGSVSLGTDVSIPKFLGQHTKDGWTYMTVQAVPRGARGLRNQNSAILLDAAQRLVRAANGLLTKDELTQQLWYRNAVSIPWLASHARRLLATGEPLPVGLVHGDFDRKNAVIVGHNLWLLDWEMSDPRGPRLTDITRHVMQNRGRKQRRGADLLSEVARVTDVEITHRELLAALVFAAQAGWPPARRELASGF